jgi:hypothetical protein
VRAIKELDAPGKRKPPSGGRSADNIDSGNRTTRGLRKPVSVTYRTSLRRAETEIGKWRAETGSTKPPVLT